MADRRPIPLAPLLLLLGGGLALRLQVSHEFHAPAGDGIGFHAIAHELRSHGRYAFGPNQPLDWSREPAWPVVVAAIDRGQGNDLESTLLWGTRLNALLDTLTALFVFLAARELALGWAAWLALALTVSCPLLILDSCYLLRETLSTTVATAAIWMALRSLARRETWPLYASSSLIGLGMLVRFDLLLLGPALLVPWARLPAGTRRLRVAALCLLACAATFSPWPARNLVQFGALHPAGGMWADHEGRPLPTGERWWVRTWVDGVHAAWLNLRLVNHMSVGERDVLPEAAASPAERRDLMAIFDAYNKNGHEISPAIDADFRALARRRVAEHPLRVLLLLPLQRAALWWWHFPPPEEQPLRCRALHQPEWRFLFDGWSHLLSLLGLAGLLVLAARPRGRDFALFAALAMVLRSVAMSVAGPDGGYQRYLAPVYPLLLLVIAALAAEAVRWARTHLPTSSPNLQL